MTRLWSDVERGGADRDDVVDLARMNDANERIAHHDDVQIRRRQRTRKFVQRLVRQTAQVSQFVTQCELSDLRVFAAATDKTEDDLFTVSQLQRGFEQSVERMTRTVVAGIHHHEPIRESVLLSK